MIPVILIRPSELSCPYCKKLLRRGKPRFGPEVIKCWNCSHELKTGLTSWVHLSRGDKFIIGASEIIAPSRWGTFMYALLLEFVMCLPLSIFIACPMSVIHSFLTVFTSETSATFIVFLLIIMIPLVLLIIMGIRLFRLVKESKQYSYTGIPPLWKAGIW